MSDQLILAYQIVPHEFFNTLYMVAASSFLAVFIGGAIGLFLVISSPKHLAENSGIYRMIGAVMNLGRSIPFVILMVALLPLTRWIVGTSLGTTASIVPLTIAAIPFFARIVETSLLEVDKGVVEAAAAMGSRVRDVVFKVLIPEAAPSLILGTANLVINVIGYSAMAGIVGGGGLGKIAIQYGYHRFNAPLMLITVSLLVLFVQSVQWGGNRAAKLWNQRIGRAFR